MAPAYPTRSGGVRPGRAGFQSPRPGGNSIPRLPANDNRPVPKPANDNVLSFKQAAAAGRRVFGVGRAALGLFGLGLTAYELYEWYNNQLPQQQLVFSGWTLQRECPPLTGLPPRTYWWTGTFNPGACLFNQSISPLVEGNTPQPPHNAFALNSVSEWEYNPTGVCVGLPWAACLPAVNRRVNLIRNWVRTTPGLPNINRPYPYLQPYYLPSENPNMNPQVLPILRPVPIARPRPYRDMRKQSRKHNRYMNWASPTRLVPRVVTPGRNLPEPIEIPVSPILPNQPSPRIQVYPNPKPLPGKHRNAPPPARTKERKFILAPDQKSPIGLAMNAVTESADFVNALFYAIPVALRPRWPDGSLKKLGLTDKAYQVWKHFGDIDSEVAFNNLLKNQVGDAIGGIRGRANAAALRRIYDKTGVNISTGLRQP